MGKADDSRRTKKRTQKKWDKKSSKNRVRNLAKATNENSISIKQATTQAKKTATLKKRDSLSKNKANTVYCEFYCDFVWFSMDFGEKQAKRGQFLV
ncbi:MAG: hypothetical protein J6M26_01780 [Clostridia bacterium]|nr:hypothetical protein [Clostridia bacterium]